MFYVVLYIFCLVNIYVCMHPLSNVRKRLSLNGQMRIFLLNIWQCMAYTVFFPLLQSYQVTGGAHRHGRLTPPSGSPATPSHRKPLSPMDDARLRSRHVHPLATDLQTTASPSPAATRSRRQREHGRAGQLQGEDEPQGEAAAAAASAGAGGAAAEDAEGRVRGDGRRGEWQRRRRRRR